MNFRKAIFMLLLLVPLIFLVVQGETSWGRLTRKTGDILLSLSALCEARSVFGQQSIHSEALGCT